MFAERISEGVWGNSAGRALGAKDCIVVTPVMEGNQRNATGGQWKCQGWALTLDTHLLPYQGRDAPRWKKTGGLISWLLCLQLFSESAGNSKGAIYNLNEKTVFFSVNLDPPLCGRGPSCSSILDVVRTDHFLATFRPEFQCKNWIVGVSSLFVWFGLGSSRMHGRFSFDDSHTDKK